MRTRTDDPLADFAAYDDEQQEWLGKRPVCVDCGEHIQDEYFFLINDEPICTECLVNNHKHCVEDYIG